MRIACAHDRAAVQVLDVLQRHLITRGVSWEGGSPIDPRIWVTVNAALDPAVEAAIRRDIESIAGAKVQE